MYALVDCNSFYASCERLFRPDLRKKPVIVLSNNDGCVVARSAEAKALGIGMAVPYFKVKQFCREHDVSVFSSNYTLYQDISNRVMCTLESLVPEVEVYSIDEAFLMLDGLPEFSCVSKPLDTVNDYKANKFAAHIRHTVFKHVGVPVGVGIAPTKTLAKLANHYAKKEHGVCVLLNPEDTDYYLKQTAVANVWGVGKGLTRKLEGLGIKSAWELAHADKYWLRKHGSIMLERTARELLGENCRTLSDTLADKRKKQIICSRSFGQRVSDKAMMREALCNYIARAAQKLREQSSTAKHMTIYFRTSMFSQYEKQRRCSASTQLIYPTNDTRMLTQAAMGLFDIHWREGYRYAKAGVALSDIYDENCMQFDLLSPVDTNTHIQSTSLLATFDRINQRYGMHAIGFGGQGVEASRKRWRMSCQSSSPRYTTNFDDLPRVS